MPAHPIVHIEFAAPDPTTSADFYAEIIGREIASIPAMEYISFDQGEGPGGGFYRIDDEMIQHGDVFVYIQMADIEATLAMVAARDGETLVPKTEIPHFGWYALFRDPAGNEVGLYTSGNTE
jgi:predicted enzyme related to lactoylglutathione lyase